MVKPSESHEGIKESQSPSQHDEPTHKKPLKPVCLAHDEPTHKKPLKPVCLAIVLQ